MKRPTRDPFYAPLDAPPPPGRVLRLRRVTVPRVGPAEAVQVVYSSVGTTDEPIAVSGTVLIPTTPWPRQTPRPVLSYGVGVHGLGRDAAPSYLLATGAEPEAALIGAALQQGWTVAVTDGEGLGMPGPHSYGAGRIGGRAMLDIARVAAGLSDVRPAPPPVALWGYSEGGRCAAWAAEQGPSYAPDLDLVGLAAGGVPTDLYAVARAIDGGPYSGLGFAVLVGLAHAHGDPRLWDILNRRGRAAARIAADLDVGGLVVAHPHPMATYTVRSDPWDEPVWRALLAAERNPVAPPEVPVHLYHAARDEMVPVRLGRELAADYRAMGVAVDWVEVDAPDHLGGAAAGARGALAFLAGVLAEREADRSGLTRPVAHR